MKKVVRMNESELSQIIKKILSEQESERYMFFSNLEQMRRQCDLLLDLDRDMVEEILSNGHDWAQDHIAEAKNNMDQVFDFIMNESKRDGMEMSMNIDDKDMVKSIEQIEVSSGSRALLTACESGQYKEIILLGFDGMNASNVYQNDEGYERSTPRNEWVQERQDIMDKFPNIKFNVV